MTLGSILRLKGSDVAHVALDTTIAAVAEFLTQRRIGAAVVCDSAHRLVGIISERDIVRSLARHGSRVLQMTAEQLMTRNPTTAPPSMSVPEAMALMTEGRFRHLPVLDGGQLAGIVSFGDVVKERISEQDHEVDSLRAYVAGAA